MNRLEKYIAPLVVLGTTLACGVGGNGTSIENRSGQSPNNPIRSAATQEIMANGHTHVLITEEVNGLGNPDPPWIDFDGSFFDANGEGWGIYILVRVEKNGTISVSGPNLHQSGIVQ